MIEQSIETMTNRIAGILSDNKPSIYLYGSIVLDDFKDGWSDIDILCLAETKISDMQAKRLLNLRQELTDEYGENLNFHLFEGGFLTLDAFVNNVPDMVVYWGTSGQRITDKYCFDPFSMIELIEHGLLLYGNEVRDRLVHPAKEEVIQAVINHYEVIRKYAVKTNRSLYSAGWLLDIARCIYTLRTNKIISKTEAGKWALENCLAPDVDIMKKVLMLREEPTRYKDDNEVLEWLENIGPYIQRFADVLEKEIAALRTD
ncbi:MAG TPA: aminoglycoside adenylyltransferase domain-containing protein [Thermoclostridium sp.]